MPASTLSRTVGIEREIDNLEHQSLGDAQSGPPLFERQQFGPEAGCGPDDRLDLVDLQVLGQFPGIR